MLASLRSYPRPALSASGVGRVGNRNCKTVPQLQACEKLVLHQPTGLVYLACSTPHNRIHWMPTLGRFNASGRSELDYVVTYDPQSDARILRPLSLGGISLHRMDVVPSPHDPSLLYVYLSTTGNLNRQTHEKLAQTLSSRSLGPTSKATSWSTSGPSRTIITPNDVVGSPDGESVHFTNDHKHKTGFSLLALTPHTSIGFCHADQGCKFAYAGLHASNGIVKGTNPGNDTFYVADCVLGEVIQTDRGLDNLAIDTNEALWAACLSDALGMIMRQINDPSALVASRIAANRGPGSFYKHNVDKMFEDPGELASGSTSTVYDAQRAALCAWPHITAFNGMQAMKQEVLICRGTFETPCMLDGSLHLPQENKTRRRIMGQ